MPDNIEKNLVKVIEKAKHISGLMPSDIQEYDHGLSGELSDAYQDYLSILNIIEGLIESADAILAPHYDIQASDEQYEDPEMWWAIPLKDGLLEAKEELESCANDLDFIISEIDVGDDVDSIDFAIYSYELDTFTKQVEKVLKTFREN